MSDEHKTVSVRNVDQALWRQFRTRAVEQGATLSAQLQIIIKDWLRARREARRDR